MLTKAQVIEEAKNRNHFIDENKRIYFKVIDYTNNPIAPEKIAYKLYYYNSLTGKREKYSFWPNTVGFQGLR